MTDPLGIEQNSVDEVLVGAGAVPVGLARVEEQLHVIAERSQPLGEVDEGRTLVLLADKVEAGDEPRQLFLQLMGRDQVLVQLGLLALAQRRVNQLHAHEVRVVLEESEDNEWSVLLELIEEYRCV